MLGALQRGLEELYRLNPESPVQNFLVDSEARDAAGVARTPREQLLVSEDEKGLSVGLYFDAEVLHLASGQDAASIANADFGDFLMLVEGVSHFVYLAYRAGLNHRLSALELELQAEVDKYVTCLLSGEQTDIRSRSLRDRLYCQVEYDEELDPQEQDRYRVANNNALRYSESLERRFVRERRVGEMLVELRHFYRMSLQSKMRFIRQAA